MVAYAVPHNFGSEILDEESKVRSLSMLSSIFHDLKEEWQKLGPVRLFHL